MSNATLLKQVLENRIKAAMESWRTDGIYVVSLWVQDWDDNPFEPTVTLGYNTEEQVAATTPQAFSENEARWNFAFWLQNEELVFGGHKPMAAEGSTALLADWVRGMDLMPYEPETIWEELPDEEIDHAVEIGEQVTAAFVGILVDIVRDLHDTGFVQRVFGHEVPIIIHELEYYELIAEQNIEANGRDLIPEGFIRFCYGE